MTRILLVNVNTTAAATDAMVASARVVTYRGAPPEPKRIIGRPLSERLVPGDGPGRPA